MTLHVNILINSCFYLSVVVEEGSDAVLPCSFGVSIVGDVLEWKKDGQKVFVYNAGIPDDNDLKLLDDRFSHFQYELRHGNASLKIRKTKVADSGDYTCDILYNPSLKKLHVQLVVGECFHSTLKDVRSFPDGTALRVPHGLQSTSTSGLIPSGSNMPDISDTLPIMSLCTMKCHQSVVHEI